MALIEDFGTYFIGAGLATADMFGYDNTLDKPEFQIIVNEYMGSPTLAQVDGANRSIQIVVRAKTSEEASAKANALYKSLRTEDGIVNLTTERWAVLEFRQTPFKFKVDERKLIYYCFNLGVQTYID